MNFQETSNPEIENNCQNGQFEDYENEKLCFTLCIKYVSDDSGYCFEQVSQSLEQHTIYFDRNMQEITLQSIMNNLDQSVQKKFEGKIISFFHQEYQNFVFLGCVMENPLSAQLGRKNFDPDKINGCVNALGLNQKKMKLQNLITPETLKMIQNGNTSRSQMIQTNLLLNSLDPSKNNIVTQNNQIECTENLTQNSISLEPFTITLKVRERSKKEQVKSIILGADQIISSKGSRRTKERKIGEVIQKVQRWRQLYYQNCESLEEAAKKVGISKKSLDDYFLQLKNGKLNGFNFNEHKNDKIGILRNWNKHHKESQNNQNVFKLDNHDQNKHI